MIIPVLKREEIFGYVTLKMAIKPVDSNATSPIIKKMPPSMPQFSRTYTVFFTFFIARGINPL